jgi:menaquinone-dependent protoporphyrinogen oxidase
MIGALSPLPAAVARDGWGVMLARVLVAYATKLGSNTEIADAIAHVLRDHGHHASAVPAREVMGLDGWDAVVLGSAIYAAHWQKDARRFASRFHDGLAVRPLWLWASGPLDPRLANADLPITPHGLQITRDLEPLGHRTFGGRLAPDAPIDPQVMRTHPIGDFRDWDAIRGYARQIASALDAMSFPATPADIPGAADHPGLSERPEPAEPAGE